eukprot:TRINITY_DN6131_c0_g1_i1.p1 TRINITY_DN6131_c0_g1~~TRINITY_DN6131_c0_g1_i1.p1  ORF type:complete len:337 (-),score=93.05 TRINITY_DN6131_c0_g1_i1:210-1220(-)
MSSLHSFNSQSAQTQTQSSFSASDIWDMSFSAGAPQTFAPNMFQTGFQSPSAMWEAPKMMPAPKTQKNLQSFPLSSEEFVEINPSSRSMWVPQSTTSSIHIPKKIEERIASPVATSVSPISCNPILEDDINGQSLYKTELCRSFEENGNCRYGSKCQFAHGKHELRQVARHPKYKTEICKTFQNEGVCPYGLRCRFIHQTSEVSHDQAGSPSKLHQKPIQPRNNYTQGKFDMAARPSYQKQYTSGQSFPAMQTGFQPMKQSSPFSPMASSAFGGAEEWSSNWSIPKAANSANYMMPNNGLDFDAFGYSPMAPTSAQTPKPETGSRLAFFQNMTESN